MGASFVHHLLGPAGSSSDPDAKQSLPLTFDGIPLGHKVAVTVMKHVSISEFPEREPQRRREASYTRKTQLVSKPI